MTWLAHVLCDPDLSEAFEADVLYSGRRLSDFTARELALMASAPRRGSLLYEMESTRQNKDQRPWDEKEHLLGATVNVLLNVVHQLQWLNYANQDERHRSKANEPKPPKPILPPGYETPKKILTRAKDVAKYMSTVVGTS